MSGAVGPDRDAPALRPGRDLLSYARGRVWRWQARFVDEVVASVVRQSEGTATGLTGVTEIDVTVPGDGRPSRPASLVTTTGVDDIDLSPRNALELRKRIFRLLCEEAEKVGLIPPPTMRVQLRVDPSIEGVDGGPVDRLDRWWSLGLKVGVTSGEHPSPEPGTALTPAMLAPLDEGGLLGRPFVLVAPGEPPVIVRVDQESPLVRIPGHLLIAGIEDHPDPRVRMTSVEFELYDDVVLVAGRGITVTSPGWAGRRPGLVAGTKVRFSCGRRPDRRYTAQNLVPSATGEV